MHCRHAVTTLVVPQVITSYDISYMYIIFTQITCSGTCATTSCASCRPTHYDAAYIMALGANMQTVTRTHSTVNNAFTLSVMVDYDSQIIL